MSPGTLLLAGLRQVASLAPAAPPAPLAVETTRHVETGGLTNAIGRAASFPTKLIVYIFKETVREGASAYTII